MLTNAPLLRIIYSLPRTGHSRYWSEHWMISWIISVFLLTFVRSLGISIPLNLASAAVGAVVVWAVLTALLAAYIRYLLRGYVPWDGPLVAVLPIAADRPTRLAVCTAFLALFTFIFIIFIRTNPGWEGLYAPLVVVQVILGCFLIPHLMRISQATMRVPESALVKALSRPPRLPFGMSEVDFVAAQWAARKPACLLGSQKRTP